MSQSAHRSSEKPRTSHPAARVPQQQPTPVSDSASYTSFHHELMRKGLAPGASPAEALARARQAGNRRLAQWVSSRQAIQREFEDEPLSPEGSTATARTEGTGQEVHPPSADEPGGVLRPPDTVSAGGLGDAGSPVTAREDGPVSGAQPLEHRGAEGSEQSVPEIGVSQEEGAEAGQAQAQADTVRAEGQGVAEQAGRQAEEQAQAESPTDTADVPESVAAGSEPDATLQEEDLPAAARDVLARAQALLGQNVTRVADLLASGVTAVLSPASSVIHMLTTMATAAGQGVTFALRSILGPISSLIQGVAAQASSLLDSARRAAAAVVSAVTSVLGPAAEVVQEQIRGLRRQAYTRVVAMIRSARERGVQQLSAVVARVVGVVQRVGQQIRDAIQRAIGAVTARLAEARARVRAVVDEYLGRGGPLPQRTADWLRGRLRGYARARVLALPRIVGRLRAGIVAGLRGSLESGLGVLRGLWADASSAFRETFAGPLAEAREHVPEIVGQVELGVSEGETQMALPGTAVEVELAMTEVALAAGEAGLQAEAELTGQTL
ncbi:MAG: hypothetical protein ACYC4R_14970 [Anaerolineae bacterium]